MAQQFELLPSADALSPQETEAKAESIGVSKAQSPRLRTIILSVLAGAFISFGGLYYCVIMGDSSLSFALQRVGAGLCFCLGLVLVICCGAELFTGNILMVCGKASRKISFKQMLLNWLIVWFADFVGALIVVGLVVLAQVPDMNGGLVGQAMVHVAQTKVSPDWFVLLAKGILCNIFVALAVWISYSARSVTDKVLGIILPISAFVAAGFEHCVANMFFLPVGLMAQAGGYGDASVLTLGDVFYNLSAATLGNIIGGVLVGLAFWFAFAQRKAPEAVVEDAATAVGIEHTVGKSEGLQRAKGAHARS